MLEERGDLQEKMVGASDPDKGRSRLSVLAVLPFSIKVRSQTATSPASLLNSRTFVSRSEDHLLTISSIVFPRSIDGGGTDIAVAVLPTAVEVAASPDRAGEEEEKQKGYQLTALSLLLSIGTC